jgi:DtxR family Mn-dependent transcriptional regulator
MKEDTYIRVVYRAFEDGVEVVGPSYFASKLGISKVTAQEALLKLASMNYGEYIPKKGFKLNKLGIEKGKNATRKHRLIECFLHELGLNSKIACDEATRIECYVSNTLIDTLKERFQEREFCPCGKEIR